MTATALTGIRASGLKTCARMEAYRESGAEGRERSDAENRWLFRGKHLGRMYADWLRREHGEDAVETEVEIPWALGVGHADILLKPTSTLIEVFSSLNPSAEAVRDKLRQLTLYLMHHPAENGALVILSPADFTEDRTILSRSSRLYRELQVDVILRIEQIRRWQDTGELPPRVCRKPSEATGRFCPFAATCFNDWDATIPVVDAAEVLEAAKDWLSAKQEERESQAIYERAKETRKKLEETFDFLEPGESGVGPYVIRRTDVTRKPSFQWEKAEAAGLFEPGLYPDCWKPGASYTRFDVTRGDGDASEDFDFGEGLPF